MGTASPVSTYGRPSLPRPPAVTPHREQPIHSGPGTPNQGNILTSWGYTEAEALTVWHRHSLLPLRPKASPRTQPSEGAETAVEKEAPTASS